MLGSRNPYAAAAGLVTAVALVIAGPQPAVAQEPAPQITVEPGELTSAQGPDETVTHELTIGNTGDGDLEWSVFETVPARLPRGGTRAVAAAPPAGSPDGGAALASRPRLAGGLSGPPVSGVPAAGVVAVPGLEEEPAQDGAVTISHSTSAEIVAGNSVACSSDSGITTTENGYLRHFTLADFGITSGFDVTSVSFGVESLSTAQALTVRLYTMTDPAGPFTYDNLTELGATEAELAAQDLTTVQVPVTGTAPAGSTLVVEVDVPDMSGVGGFFAGSNPDGQTAPSYLRSESCGLPEPTDTAAIGFPGMHLVMSVTGDAEVAQPDCEVPSGASWVDVDPVSGTVTPGGAQAVQVTFDSTGMAGGDERQANLCLASNDPAAPLVVVPLTLRVEQVAAPAIEVTPESLAAELVQGESTARALTVGNAGDAPLAWEIGEAPPPSDREALLRQGVLLIPESSNDRVMAFDPQTGDLIDPDFIPFNEAAELATPIHAILNQDQDGFLLSDQSADVVHSYDLDGNWRGVFAPAGGADSAIANNIRGIALSPAGTLLVTVASGGNADAVAEFDAAGEFTGNFIDNQAGGLDSPWSVVFRESDVLVSASDSDAILRFQPDGTPDGAFHSGINFPEQVLELAGGNVLAAQFSSGGGGPPGVWEMDASGELIGVYTGVSGNRGVYELPNGNILTTNSGGVHEIDRGSSLVETKLPGVGARFITHVRIDAPECDAPADVPWLAVSPGSATTPPGGSTEVTVTFDATGLEPGEHRAVLCVSSNDPATPLVEVPVALTVQEAPTCDRTITGVHDGPLTVSEGTTCLSAGAQVLGEVNVQAGAGLIATAAVIQGPVSAVGASVLELTFTQVTGPVLVSGGSGRVSLFASQVTGSVSLFSNATGEVPTVSGNTIIGSLSCFANEPAPTDHGLPNTATGGKLGQCAGL